VYYNNNNAATSFGVHFRQFYFFLAVFATHRSKLDKNSQKNEANKKIAKKKL
jgi:hypothetical protein